MTKVLKIKDWMNSTQFKSLNHGKILRHDGYIFKMGLFPNQFNPYIEMSAIFADDIHVQINVYSEEKGLTKKKIEANDLDKTWAIDFQHTT